ncbi:MAG: virB8 family protein [Rickettsiaceae bacterium]|nr:virB8 family protein [Rickettsiaceae bacterium]
MVVQRNLLLLLVFVCIVSVVLSVMSVTKIATSKKFDPFVIQIDEKTGSAKVVTPVAEDILTRDDSITRYFIKKYIVARESYNPVDFATQGMETVRVLSHPMIFMLYRSYINGQDTNPVTKYGQSNTTYVTMKSWSRIEEKKYLVRFAIHETAGSKRVYNKIAVVLIEYASMELREEERDINPLGFQIMGYGVSDDDS